MTDPAVASADDALERLKRAYGQLGGLIRMVEDGRTCTDTLTLLAAITHALHRAGFRLVAANLERSLRDREGADTPSIPELEKLFLSLG